MTVTDDEIVQKNVELMRSKKDGGMRAIARFESVGGNASAIRTKEDVFPCIGVNFVYDAQGEIVCFGNNEDIPKLVMEKVSDGSLTMGQFRVVIRSENNFNVARKFISSSLFQFADLFGLGSFVLARMVSEFEPCIVEIRLRSLAGKEREVLETSVQVFNLPSSVKLPYEVMTGLL